MPGTVPMLDNCSSRTPNSRAMRKFCVLSLSNWSHARKTSPIFGRSAGSQ